MLFRSILFALLSTSLVLAKDWPSWRGPDGLGVTTEKNLPVEWGKEKNVVWKSALPGKGASSPVIVNGRVYLTAQTEDTALHVLAFEAATGKLLWDREINRGKLKANNLHNMATPTPSADGKFIWALFGTGHLACLDQAGKILWERNLVDDYGDYKFNHGYGSSPMLFDKKLFVVCMHQGPSYLAALDPKSGETLWKTERNLGPTDEAQDSYSSPLFLGKGRKRELVLEGAEAVTAYDPATGKELWKFGGLKAPHPYGRTISGLAGEKDIVVAVTSGFQNRGYTVAVERGGKGDLTTTHKLWTQTKFSPDCPTPVAYEGKLFMIRDDGMASCLDLKTGEPYWQERLFTENVKISPIAGDGKVYFTSGRANCQVLKASTTFQVLAKNELNEPTLATPSPSGGKLFIRTDSNLYCIGK